MTDGVYVDASFREGAAGLAAVLVNGDKQVDVRRRYVPVAGSAQAEILAVQLARESFPEWPIHCDCSGVAHAAGVTWISRKENRFAHREAAKALNRDGWSKRRRAKQRKIKKKFRGSGRGVVAVGQNRFVA